MGSGERGAFLRAASVMVAALSLCAAILALPGSAWAVRTDCESCHGAVAPTTDGSQPSATVTGYPAAWAGGGSNGPTPHKGYATSTNKCSFCHAVHNASRSGQMLLRGSADAACEYCHIYTDLGQVVIYDGDPANYYATDDDAAHNRSPHSECTSCHSVHGAATLGGACTTKILWDWKKSGRHAYSPQALAAWPDPSSVANENAQLTAWCTGCHSYYTREYNEPLEMQRYDHEVSYEMTRVVACSHIMTDLAGGYANPKAILKAGTQVAWVPSLYCRSCHDAGRTNEGPGIHADSFPHFVEGYWRFMSIGASAEDSGYPNLQQQIDGLCLKCHRKTVDSGVGVDY